MINQMHFDALATAGVAARAGMVAGSRPRDLILAGSAPVVAGVAVVTPNFADTTPIHRRTCID